jgi:hypothetical protein
MGCNCGGSAPKSTDKYVVTTDKGMVKEFDDEPEARIFATMNQGRVTVRKKN